jgi:hypothetical protein
VGVGLQVHKQQAEIGDIVLLYGAESEALTHDYLARAWGKAGRDLRVAATPTHCPHESDQADSDFVAHLKQLDQLYGIMPGQPTKPSELVEDNGPIHTNKVSLAALVARAHWLTIVVVARVYPRIERHRGRVARPSRA